MMRRNGIRRPHPALTLCSIAPTAQIHNAHDIDIDSITSDSRRVKPGDVFVAIEGSHHDGHEFVAEAIRRGANSIIAERKLSVQQPVGIVASTRQLIAVASQKLNGDPSKRLATVGITGKNGNTVAAFLLHSIITAGGMRCGLLSSIEHYDGLGWTRSEQATPDPETLALTLKRMVANGCSHVVMELSAQGLAEQRVAGVEFDTLVNTNDQSQYRKQDRFSSSSHPFASHETYRNSEPFRLLGTRNWAVVNRDDPQSQKLIENCKAHTLTYGRHPKSGVSIQRLKSGIDGSRIELKTPLRAERLLTRMLGQHNAWNIAAAVAAAGTIGCGERAIHRGIAQLGCIPGRMERIQCGQPFEVVVDCARTPEALRTVTNSLRKICPGRVLCLLGVGTEDDHAMRASMARAVEPFADQVFVTGDHHRTECSENISTKMIEGFPSTANYTFEPLRLRTIRMMIEQAEPGDCLLITGRRQDERQNGKDLEAQFDDRIVSRHMLESIMAFERSTFPSAA